jgi:hypothetical protein
VWGDVFEYCLAVCRTHGRSTSHENAYIGPRHHCFSKLGKPMVSSTMPGLLQLLCVLGRGTNIPACSDGGLPVLALRQLTIGWEQACVAAVSMCALDRWQG